MPGKTLKNLSVFLQEAVRQYDTSIALKIKRKGVYESLTYKSLSEKVNQLASGLHEKGVRRADRVVVLFENSPEWVLAYFAIVKLGAIVVPIDPKLSEKEILVLLNHCEPSFIFCSFSSQELFLRNSEDLHFVKGFVCLDNEEINQKEKWILFQELLLDKSRDVLDCVEENDLAVMIYTSGTTGNPKGVMLSHRNLLYYPCLVAHDSQFIEKNGRMLLFLPLHHIYPTGCLLVGLASGAEITFLPDFKAGEMISLLNENKITAIVGVPRLYEFLHKEILEGMERTGYSPKLIEKLRRWSRWLQKIFGTGVSKIIFRRIHRRLGGHITSLASGGAHLKSDIFNFFKDFGFSIQEGYGLTETAGCIALNSRNGMKAGKAGPVLSGTHIKIEQAQSDGVGEILVSGPSIFQGYYKNENETANVLRDGWFRTGDLGRLDSHGYLHITGRKKDVIVLPSGKNVYPDEIEILYAHPGLIKQIGVIGFDRGRGEEVFACIVPNFKDAEEMSKRTVELRIKEHLAHVSAKLSSHKRISGYQFFYEKIPTTPLNKIKRHELKATLEKNNLGIQHKIAGNKELNAKQKVLDLIKDHFTGRRSAEQLHLEMDLGMDSLSRTEMWAAIERDMRVSIPDEEKFRMKDTLQIIEFLKNRQNLKPSFSVSPSQTETDWMFLLNQTSSEISRKTKEVLNASPRTRVIFLKIFFHFFTRFLNLKVKGLQNIPKTGPFIIAPNHECHLDNLFVACFLPSGIQKNMAVMGKKEHFDSFMTRWAIRLCNGISVDRENASAFALQIGAQFLREGKTLLIHPEGTRSPDGNLLPFKNGVSLLSLHQQCPVIPVYIEGAHEFWPKNTSFPKLRNPVSVFIGEPLLPGPLATGANILEEAENFTKKIRQSVENLKADVESLSRHTSSLRKC